MMQQARQLIEKSAATRLVPDAVLSADKPLAAASNSLPNSTLQQAASYRRASPKHTQGLEITDTARPMSLVLTSVAADSEVNASVPLSARVAHCPGGVSRVAHSYVDPYSSESPGRASRQPQQATDSRQPQQATGSRQPHQATGSQH